MSEKNGLEIFGCWICLVQVASLCRVRGDLSQYDINDLSRLTLCDTKIIEKAILYLSQTLDWIEVVDNLDKNVIECQNRVMPNCDSSSMLCNVVLSKEGVKGGKFKPPNIEEVIKYFLDNGYPEELARRCYEGYATAGWRDSKGNPVRSWKQKAQHVWFKPESREKSCMTPTEKETIRKMAIRAAEESSR